MGSNLKLFLNVSQHVCKAFITQQQQQQKYKFYAKGSLMNVQADGQCRSMLSAVSTVQ